MNIDKTINYLFKNDIIQFESHVDEFTDEIFNELDLLAEKLDLHKKIDDLIDGKVVNNSENQAALHPKYRGILNSSETPKNLIDAKVKVEEFYKNRCDSFKDEENSKINIINLGIGGSYEGPKLLLESLKNPIGFQNKDANNINYEFITGSDPYEFEHKTKSLEPFNTIFLVSSKSFTTYETLDSLKKALEWSKNTNNFIAITANPNEVSKYGIKDVITFDKEIGGRYSVWSPITQFHLCGKQRASFIEGGHQADIDIQKNKEYLKFLKILSYSDIWLNNVKGKHTRAIFCYDWNLRSLPNYFQQLEMESLGKHPNSKSKFKQTGQIVFGGFGPRAQHSYFQLLHQGSQEICADIILTREDQKSLNYAQGMTQSKLLSKGQENLQKGEKINGNVPVNLFTLNKLDSYTLGYLIASWEYRVFITATMLEINPFDQFGVEAGKNSTIKFLEDN
tara:strand:- start:71422 stop:72774 length:1353 start_codon:yes stop_codon:yes gene_type:complete